MTSPALRLLGQKGARAAALHVTLAGVALSGCARDAPNELTVVDGATITHFPVRGAFAEYVELPGAPNELRLSLASYPVSCERFVPPKEGDSLVTVVVVLPPGQVPVVGSYAWAGVPAQGAQEATTAYALPKATFGTHSRLFEPGGALKLTAVQLDPRGVVSGTLAFEFPGEGDRPATRIDGRFDAKMCRLSLAPR